MSGGGTEPGSIPRSMAELSHAELAILGREYLLGGQMIDRAGMPHLISHWGRDEMRDIAIDEWMGASPIYTKRMQRALRFEGDSVTTIFKGMQLDVGAPPEFMDFRYKVEDDNNGEFWLAHCGALMDVEPMGDDYVVAMCHHIEDPTFDATACASNPRAHMEPIHRPPRVPDDRHPHCHWSVDIDPAREPLTFPEVTGRIGATLAAGTEIELFGTDGGPGEDPDDAGWPDYAAALDPDMRLEDFSRRALSIICQEAALQGHLLSMSFIAGIEARHGTELAVEIGARQLCGISGLTAGRLRAAFGLGSSPADIAQVFELHPVFHPRSYVQLEVTVHDDTVPVELGPGDALAEVSIDSWITILRDGGGDDAIAAIARAVDPRATSRPAEPTGDNLAAWEITIGTEVVPEAADVALARFSSGADFTFRRTGRRDPDAVGSDSDSADSDRSNITPPEQTVSIR